MEAPHFYHNPAEDVSSFCLPGAWLPFTCLRNLRLASVTLCPYLMAQSETCSFLHALPAGV